MFPWATLISLGAQAASGIASSINNKNMQAAADNAAARQESYYEGKAAQNPIATSGAQHVIHQYDRDAQRTVQNAQNKAKITGATPEYTLAVQDAALQGKADLLGKIEAGASARAERYEDKAEAARHQKELDDQQRRAERNTTYANLAANAANSFGGIMDAYMPKETTSGRTGADDGRVARKAAAPGTETGEEPQPKSALYDAGAELTNNPIEKGAFQSLSQAAKEQEAKTATGTATGTAATGSAAVSDPEPDPSDFVAHLEWQERQNRRK